MSVVGRKQIAITSPKAPAEVVARAIPDRPAANGRATPFRMPRVQSPRFPDRTVDIRDHGATAGGVSDCTVAINQAIDACAQAGGGRILIPSGQWLTGPIHLKSNVALHLEEDAVLVFSDDPLKYLPPVFVRWGGQECFNFSPLIYAFNCRNIAITGGGQLIGRGEAWWKWQANEARSHKRLHQMVLKNVSVNERRFGTEKYPLRPQFIHLVNCTQVLLEGFAIPESGPHVSIHLAYCRDTTVRKVDIHTPQGPDNDGIVIDSCRNLLVEDCQLLTNGACIALKSGLNEDAWRVDKPTQNVVIRSVRVTGGDSGVLIGSEISAGLRNLLVESCSLEGVQAGIRILSARGRGGVVEYVYFRGITMDRISAEAILMTADTPAYPATLGKVSTFRHIHFEDVKCAAAGKAVRIVGLPDRHFQDIRLKNVHITADEGLQCSAGSRIDLVDVSILPRHGPVFSVKDSQEILIHGLNNTHSDNIFLDVRGRQTRNIRLRGEASEQVRPTIVLGIDVPRDALVHE